MHINKSLPGACRIFSPSGEEVVADSEFEASWDYVVRPSFKNKQKLLKPLKPILTVKLLTVYCELLCILLLCQFVFGFLFFFIFSVVYITLIFGLKSLMGFYDWFPPYPLGSLDFKTQSHTVERTRQKGEEKGGREASLSSCDGLQTWKPRSGEIVSGS